MSKIKHNLIRAAGGLVWRKNGDQTEILLIHRERYADWTLPKGKLKKGERWQEAALREVAEETGLAAHLEDFAGLLYYTVDGAPKVVLFWHMAVIGPADASFQPDSPEEVSAVAWLTVPEAIQRMSYPDERELLHTLPS